MIILLHGTGDDSNKPENWMGAVAQLMRKHREHVLVLPGVGSKDAKENRLGDYVNEFMESMDEDEYREKNNRPSVSSEKALEDALRKDTGEELDMALKAEAGKEQEVIDSLVKNQRGEENLSNLFAPPGIKLRIAIAGLCALAYWRRLPLTEQKPIRIIGHSRGGSTAVGLHNFLSYHGIRPKTLTLDPCHGLNKGRHLDDSIRKLLNNYGIPHLPSLYSSMVKLATGDVKDYYTKIWMGTLINQPVVDEVAGMPPGSTIRPEIGQFGSAKVENKPKLKKIKHGHMGKFKAFSGEGQEAARDRIKNDIEAFLGGVNDGVSPRNNLEALFKRFTDDKEKEDYDDRVEVQKLVIETLTAHSDRSRRPGGRKSGRSSEADGRLGRSVFGV